MCAISQEGYYESQLRLIFRLLLWKTIKRERGGFRRPSTALQCRPNHGYLLTASDLVVSLNLHVGNLPSGAVPTSVRVTGVTHKAVVLYHCDHYEQFQNILILLYMWCPYTVSSLFCIPVKLNYSRKRGRKRNVFEMDDIYRCFISMPLAVSRLWLHSWAVLYRNQGNQRVSCKARVLWGRLNWRHSWKVFLSCYTL